MSDKPTGPEILEQAAAEPTLDELMRRDPVELTHDDLLVIVRQLRAERAQFITASEDKKAKKSGANMDEEGED